MRAFAFCLNGLFRSSPASGSGVVGRRCVDLRRAEVVQTTAAALHDAKAFTTARRLGIFSSKQQQPQKTARSGATDAATSARRTSDVASGHSAAPNSRRKRSAARSARHHAQIQVQLYRTAIAVIYFCRLRRKCRAQRLHAHLADLESLEAQSVRSYPGGYRAARLYASPVRPWRRRSRSEPTALHHLPPRLCPCQTPQAVLHCLRASTWASTRRC